MSIIIGLIVFITVYIIFNKLWCFWSRSKVCLVGKTAIVTGGGSGLGFQTALSLAANGCRIIIADIANISEAVEKIIEETHNTNIIGKKVDLASFKSVREFAKYILESESRLDILICNAGVGEVDKFTEDGILTIMQVNYFSHFLLTHLLLDLLKKSAPSRIVFTSSVAAYVSDMSIDTLNPTRDYFSKHRSNWHGWFYSSSKLALAAAAKVLSKKLKGSGITVNVVHPAGVKTSIYTSSLKKNLHIGTIVLAILVYLTGKTAEEGAQTLIHLAKSDSVKKYTGQSFYEGMRVPRPFQLRNNDFCEKVWDESVKITKLSPHEILY